MLNLRDSDARMKSRHRGSPLLALLLLVPAPSIGVYLAMVCEPTQGTFLGKAAYALAKVWLVAFPVYWLLFVQRGNLSLSPARRGGFGVAITLGIAISALILGTEALFGAKLVDPQIIRDQAAKNDLDSVPMFIALALYLALVNSLIEEFVWRWFVFRRCEKLLGRTSAALAVIVSALLFTVHHTIALKVQLDWPVTYLCSFGIFTGGAAWSWLYLKYRSIWPGYVSHLIVDVAILYLAWRYIFG